MDHDGNWELLLTNTHKKQQKPTLQQCAAVIRQLAIFTIPFK